MKLPSFKRVFYTDYQKDFQQVIEQLSYTINQGFENLYNALNNNLTLADNLAVTVRDVTLTAGADGTPTSTASFTISNSNTISGLQVIRVTTSNGSTVYPTAGIFISYTQSANSITVNHITGLPAGTQFVVRVVAYLT